MSEEQATSNKEKRNISPVEAYNILLQRQISEDRIVTERTTIFLGASSILFLAFVMLLNPTLAPVFKVLRIALPILGISLTLLLYGINRAAINAVNFWHIGQHKIEEEAPEFAYMRDNEIASHIHADECMWGRKEWRRNTEGRWILAPIEKPRSWLRYPVLWYGHQVRYFPLIFFVLWVVSLIVAIIY